MWNAVEISAYVCLEEVTIPSRKSQCAANSRISPPTNSTGISVIDKPFLKIGFHNADQGMMDHAFLKDRGRDQPFFRIVNGELVKSPE